MKDPAEFPYFDERFGKWFYRLEQWQSFEANHQAEVERQNLSLQVIAAAAATKPDLSDTVSGAEGELQALRAEVAALRAANAELQQKLYAVKMNSALPTSPPKRGRKPRAEVHA